MSKLGVTHIEADVTAVLCDDHGYISAIKTEHAGDIEGDLFIDCTGFKSMLLGEHYGVSLKSQRKYLFNNAALAVQVPYDTDDAPIAATTHSTAQRNGWVWDIGLQHRRGVGHVFSTDYQSAAETEEVLDQYLKSTGRAAGLDGLTPRLLSFEPGYRERFGSKIAWALACQQALLSRSKPQR